MDAGAMNEGLERPSDRHGPAAHVPTQTKVGLESGVAMVSS